MKEKKKNDHRSMIALNLLSLERSRLSLQTSLALAFPEVLLILSKQNDKRTKNKHSNSKVQNVKLRFIWHAKKDNLML